jgi:hypothetical protein
MAPLYSVCGSYGLVGMLGGGVTMSDLVDRLRDEINDCPQCHGHGSWLNDDYPEGTLWDPCLLCETRREAADEIERLQRVVDAAGDVARPYRRVNAHLSDEMELLITALDELEDR